MTLGKSAAVAALVAAAAAASGQSESPTPSSRPLDAALSLSEIKDFSFSYAQPGFYALLRDVKVNGIDESTALSDVRWVDMLERPADFRGRVIRLRGAVGGNRRWKHTSEEYADLGFLSELLITKADEPIICKVIFTGNAADLPVGAIVEFDARFLTIQHYYSESKRQCQAAVFVGVGPTRFSTEGAGPAGRPFDWTGPIFATTAGFAIAYLILRRTVSGRRPIESLRASRAAPMNLADDLASWAGRESSSADSIRSPGHTENDGTRPE